MAKSRGWQKLDLIRLFGNLPGWRWRSVFLFVLFLFLSPVSVFAVQNSISISFDVYNLENSSFTIADGYIWLGMDDTVGGSDFPGCNPAIELCIHSDGLGGNKPNILFVDFVDDFNFYFAIYPTSNVDGSLQHWKLDIDSVSGVVKLYINGSLQVPIYIQDNFSAIDFTGIDTVPYYSWGAAVYESLLFSFGGLDLSGVDVSVLYVFQLAMVIMIAIAGIWILRKVVKLAGWS